VPARQIRSLLEIWQLLQQSSFASSQTAPDLNLQVEASQHWLLPQLSAPPQSQSSPSSTMPLPHCWPLMVVTPRLLLKHCVLTELRSMAEQMFPIEHGENWVMPSAVDGFMM